MFHVQSFYWLFSTAIPKAGLAKFEVIVTIYSILFHGDERNFYARIRGKSSTVLCTLSVSVKIFIFLHTCGLYSSLLDL